MAASSTSWQVAGRAVRVTSLDKPYWPPDGLTKDGLTKGDLLGYYRDLAPILLPYCTGRPVTARVFPRGIHGPGYYRREIPDNAPSWVRSADYQAATDGHPVRVLLVDDAAGLIWLANTGAIELHLWGAHLPDLAEPDMAIFDLDPGDAATFTDVLEAAQILHAELESLGLRSYPKTSGGHGLHVFLPLAPGHTLRRSETGS